MSCEHPKKPKQRQYPAGISRDLLCDYCLARIQYVPSEMVWVCTNNFCLNVEPAVLVARKRA